MNESAKEYDPHAIRNYFGIYEDAFLDEFGMRGFDAPGGRHAPSPFLGLNKCIGQLVTSGVVSEDARVLVLGSGDARVNVAFNNNGRESYGLEQEVNTYKLGRLTVRALQGAQLIRSRIPLVLGFGDFFDPISYDPLGYSFHDFSTLYHHDGTGNSDNLHNVAQKVVDESRPGTVLLLATYREMPSRFDGLSCALTYRLWGGKKSVDGMFLHVYTKSKSSGAELRRKHARVPVGI